MTTPGTPGESLDVTMVDTSGLEQSIDKICTAIDRLREERAELLSELKRIVERFHHCLVTTGSDPEFADAAVAKARTLIAKAEATS